VDRVIVIGLGNPGTEHEGTRHNVGFDVVTELAQRFRKSLHPGRGEFVEARHKHNGSDFILAKPTTYMNNSGIAVVDLLDRYGGSQSELLVVTDDFALPLGMTRVRAKGSDGGHNGLYSVIYHLNSFEFARIRCGIGKDAMPPKTEMAEFVLSPFEQEEKPIVTEMIRKAADIVVEFAEIGAERTMARINKKL
jgi:peptidyl-tRNA hydrolase, PTH1 family